MKVSTARWESGFRSAWSPSAVKVPCGRSVAGGAPRPSRRWGVRPRAAPSPVLTLFRIEWRGRSTGLAAARTHCDKPTTTNRRDGRPHKTLRFIEAKQITLSQQVPLPNAQLLASRNPHHLALHRCPGCVMRPYWLDDDHGIATPLLHIEFLARLSIFRPHAPWRRVERR